MKKAVLNLKFGAYLKGFQKLALLFLLLFALGFSVDAQRRGGGFGHVGAAIAHGGFSRGGFTHVGYAGRGFGEFRGSHWHYSFFPRWGGFYGYLPYPYINFWWGGLDYYLYNGAYYHYYGGRYEAVPAPVGYRVRSLPKGAQELAVDGNTYFYYYGAFYVPSNKKFEVVPAPVGAVVDNIPRGYEKVVAEGQTYYTFDDVQYKAIVRKNGVSYEVVKSKGAESSEGPQEAPAPVQKEQYNSDSKL
jgi:hypothetical protein